MGMEVTGLKDISPEIVPEEKENEMDTTNRYDNEFPDEDMFEQIVRNAEEAEREKERSKGKKHAIKNMTIWLLQYTCCFRGSKGSSIFPFVRLNEIFVMK